MTTAADLFALDLEYRLTVATSVVQGCGCAAYWEERHEDVMPVLIRNAESNEADLVDTFARYARGVHRRLCIAPRLADERTPDSKGPAA